MWSRRWVLSEKNYDSGGFVLVMRKDISLKGREIRTMVIFFFFLMDQCDDILPRLR